MPIEIVIQAKEFVYIILLGKPDYGVKIICHIVIITRLVKREEVKEINTID